MNIKARTFLVCLLLGTGVTAGAQVSISIGLPGVSLGVNLGGFPELVRIPGYPVYYAPQVDSNFFFYDGLFWIYTMDRWYSSPWYDGPWDMMEVESIPFYLLRVPVRYYRQPPAYFRGWGPEAPPRWGEHWGRDWERRHDGWERWDRGSAPAVAPLPMYQRQYGGDRYPRGDLQQTLRRQHYDYQPREAVTRQRYQAPPPASAPIQQEHRTDGAPHPASRHRTYEPSSSRDTPAIREAPAARERATSGERARAAAIRPAPRASSRGEAAGHREPRPEQNDSRQRGNRGDEHQSAAQTGRRAAQSGPQAPQSRTREDKQSTKKERRDDRHGSDDSDKH